MVANNIQLSNEVQHKPYLKKSDKYSLKDLSHKLLNTIYKGYNYSVDPVLALGVAIMARFRNDFLKLGKGFPVAYLYGPTSAGKTNMLNSITYLYGYNENFINSGDSTIISMWQNLDNYNSTPVIYDEISRKVINDSLFEGLIKSAYYGTNRDKISKIKTSINATLILSSNFQPPQRPEILNRLLLCSFEQQNFQLKEVIGFNEIREKYLSNLLPAVLKYPKDKAIELFNQNREYIKGLNGNIDNRSVDNIAIAYTGYQILLNIAEEDQPNEIKENLEKFIINYSETLKVDSPWEEFINALPLLTRNKSIILNTDYKYAYDRENIQENNQLTNPVPHYLCIHFEQAYIAFIKHYRQISKNAPPTNKELLSYVKNDPRIKQGKSQLTKGININGKKKRCLVIDVSKNYELSHLDII